MQISVSAAVCLLLTTSAFGQAFVNFETPQVHPIDISPDGTTLALCNTADNSIEVFDIQLGTPIPLMRIPTGLDPVTVRFRTLDEVWVVNQLSDSVSIVSLTTGLVSATLNTSDEPADVIFAGTPESAFVSCSQQDEVLVFDPANLSAPPVSIAIEGEEPRALAKSPDGNIVYAAIFESGNRSTVLAGGLVNPQPELPNVVSDPSGPYGGINPPPNDGIAFSPAFSLGLPTPPEVGLIVKKDPDTEQWLDDNGGDWTNFVSGLSAASSGRIPGWDVLDNDLAVIDANTRTVSGYATGLMNICMTVAVNPATGEISVAGTDGLNETRFEPNVNGVFLRVLGAVVDPVTLDATVTDLNFHLDYTTPTIPQSQRDLSIGDPRGVVWNQSGEIVYITGMGSNNVLVIEEALNRVNRIDIGEGPTGIALDESRNRLYVLNRFSGDLSVIDAVTEVEETRIALFDPTPAEIKAGRKHLYDTHKNSGLGHIACASCHVDARMDRLAWDLGDPSGVVDPVDGQNLGMSIPGLDTDFTDFHPMKGPMTTQTLQDIIGKEPFHWRGDRDGLENFNPAFMGLQGDDAVLDPVEMQEFEDFLATLHFPPNPNRNLDNTLPTDLPLPGEFASGRFAGVGGLNRGDPMPNGDATRGLRLYMGGESPNDSLDGSLNCVTCHTMPLGNGADSFFNSSTGLFEPFPVGPNGNHHAALVSVDGSTQRAIKTPQLRNGIEKAGMVLTHTPSRAGFGYLHDGTVDSLASFLSAAVFDVRSDQDVADLVALMLAFSGSEFNEIENPVLGLPQEPPSFQFSQDAHAVVGQQVTLSNSNPPQDVTDRMNTLLIPAIEGKTSAVIKGKKDGVQRGWMFSSFDGVETHWQSDKVGEMATGSELLAMVAPGSEQTLTAVPLGSGERIGIDRDLDAILNFDERSVNSITVLSPNGVENWEAGSQHVITWSTTGDVGANVSIRIRKGGLSAIVANSVPAASAAFIWNLPSWLNPVSGYEIEVSSVSNPLISDTSDGQFTVAAATPESLELTFPNGGESISRGSTVGIMWTSVGSTSTVEVRLLKGSLTLLLSGSTPNDGQFDWTVPNWIALSSDYRIHIRSATDTGVFDTSDATFTITP